MYVSQKFKIVGWRVIWHKNGHFPSWLSTNFWLLFNLLLFDVPLVQEGENRCLEILHVEFFLSCMCLMFQPIKTVTVLPVSFLPLTYCISVLLSVFCCHLLYSLSSFLHSFPVLVRLPKLPFFVIFLSILEAAALHSQPSVVWIFFLKISLFQR